MNNKTYHLYTDEEKLKIVKEHINNRIPIRACAKVIQKKYILIFFL